MTPAQQTVLGELLDYAGDLMSNKVCNDMEIPDTPENREMLLDFYKWQLDDSKGKDIREYEWHVAQLEKKKDQSPFIVFDWMLLAYLADRMNLKEGKNVRVQN